MEYLRITYKTTKQVDTTVLCTPVTDVKMPSHTGGQAWASWPQSHHSCCPCPSVALRTDCVQGILSAFALPQQYNHHWVGVEIGAQKNPGIWPRSYNQRIWKPGIALGPATPEERQVVNLLIISLAHPSLPSLHVKRQWPNENEPRCLHAKLNRLARGWQTLPQAGASAACLTSLCLECTETASSKIDLNQGSSFWLQSWLSNIRSRQQFPLQMVQFGLVCLS